MAGISRLIFSAVLIAAGVQRAWPQAQMTVVNAASFQSGIPSGGSLATVFCSGVANVKPGTYIASSSPLPYTLGGLSVTVNYGMAPLLAVVITSSGDVQINFQVPLERNVSLVPVQTPNGYEYQGSLAACGPEITAFPPPSGWGGLLRRCKRVCYCPARIRLQPGDASESSPCR
jgi:hypothetical protein